MSWVIYNSAGVPLVSSKNHDHTVADGSNPLTNDEHDGYSEYVEIAAPAAPAADKAKLYVADDGGVTRPYVKDSDGDVAELAGYTLLDSVTLGAPAQWLATFANIPAKYRNLRLVWHGASDTSGDATRWVGIRFNNDAAGNYDFQYFNDGVSQQTLTHTFIAVGVINGALAGYPTWGVVDIPNYANSTYRRAAIEHSGYISVGDVHNFEGVGMWGNLADAISRVEIFSDNGLTQFDTGSVAFLYGY